MKRWLLFMLLLGLLFATVTPVSAAGKSPRSNFTLAGKITAIGDSTVTIQVLAGNKVVRPFVGKEVTVTVTDATRFFFNDGTVTTPITFADLKIGDPVSVHGKVANDVWTASRITVGAKLIHFP
jgi:hypothetical protein